MTYQIIPVQLREDQDGGARLKKRMRELDPDGIGHLTPMLFRQALAAAYGIVCGRGYECVFVLLVGEVDELEGAIIVLERAIE